MLKLMPDTCATMQCTFTSPHYNMSPTLPSLQVLHSLCVFHLGVVWLTLRGNTRAWKGRLSFLCHHGSCTLKNSTVLCIAQSATLLGHLNDTSMKSRDTSVMGK